MGEGRGIFFGSDLDGPLSVFEPMAGGRVQGINPGAR